MPIDDTIRILAGNYLISDDYDNDELPNEVNKSFKEELISHIDNLHLENDDYIKSIYFINTKPLTDVKTMLWFDCAMDYFSDIVSYKQDAKLSDVFKDLNEMNLLEMEDQLQKFKVLKKLESDNIITSGFLNMLMGKKAVTYEILDQTPISGIKATGDYIEMDNKVNYKFRH